MTAAAVALGCASLGADEIVFDDVERQTRQFIEWQQTIALTPEQEAVKREALEALPAPCCSDNSAYTCCCPCNISRSSWGLANHLIAERGTSAEEVRSKVDEWTKFINPNGYGGKACYTRGGCQRPFHQDGCGGMNPDQPVF